MGVEKDMSQNASLTEIRFVASNAHAGTSSVDQGSHPHASEIEARDGGV